MDFTDLRKVRHRPERNSARVDLDQHGVGEPELVHYPDPGPILGERDDGFLCLLGVGLEQPDHFLAVRTGRDIRLL